MKAHIDMLTGEPAKVTSSRKIVYTVTEKDGKRHWTKIGCAWPSGDNVLTVKLDAIPIDGELEIRPEG